MGSTTNGFPYPESTDFVTDGAQAIEDLAVDVDANMGLWLIHSGSFTSATSHSLPNDTFTSAFRNYRITYNISVSSDSDFSVRLRKNGTDNQNSSYNTTLSGILSTGGASDANGNSQTYWFFGEQDSSVELYAVTFDLYQPKLNTRTSATGNIICVNKAASATIGRAGGWWHGTADTFDSLTFFSNVTSSMTGIVRVYGYRD